MSGPLTPPPSSAQELQDAARASVPPPEGATIAAPAPHPEPTVIPDLPPPPVQPQTPYRSVYSFISVYAANAQYEQLIRAAEESDLLPIDKSHPDRLLIIVPLVLSYLTIDDLTPAKHALTRLPEALAMRPLPTVLYKLVASASARQYEHVYVRAREVHEILQNTSVPGGDLQSVAIPLLQKFLYTFRRKAFALISKAFTSVPVPLVERYLGCSAEEVLTTAQEYKWSFDATQNILVPAPVTAGADVNALPSGLGAQSSLATFRMIADINLE